MSAWQEPSSQPAGKQGSGRPDVPLTCRTRRTECQHLGHMICGLGERSDLCEARVGLLLKLATVSALNDVDAVRAVADEVRDFYARAASRWEAVVKW